MGFAWQEAGCGQDLDGIRGGGTRWEGWFCLDCSGGGREAGRQEALFFVEAARQVQCKCGAVRCKAKAKAKAGWRNKGISLASI